MGRIFAKRATVLCPRQKGNIVQVCRFLPNFISGSTAVILVECVLNKQVAVTHYYACTLRMLLFLKIPV